MRIVLTLSAIIIILVSGCGKSNPAGPGDSEYYPITVTVLDDHNRPVVNALVVTVPWNVKLATDSTGVASLDVRKDTTSFYVQRAYYEDHYQVLTSEMFDSGVVDVALDTRGPVITIYRPTPGLVFYNPLMQFSAVAVDPEDGVLNDELVWTSDQDGELGSGAEITIGDISLGWHVITCSATDLDGNVDSTSVSILVQTQTTADPLSYFPITPLSWWEYNHLPKVYNVTRESDGLVENWILDDLRVEIDNRLRRTLTLDIQYTLRNIKKYYKYKVVDQLDVIDNAIYVTGTTETIEMRENWVDNSVFFFAEVTTAYTPEYLLIPDTEDLSTMPPSDSSVLTELFWKYKHPFENEINFTESFVVNTNISFGAPEHVVTPLVTVEAIPVTFNLGDTHKTWWLSQGAGIVKMEYLSYAVPTTAVLTATSISKPSSRPVITAPAFSPATISFPSLKPAAGNNQSSQDLSDVQRLREVAKGFLPR